MNTKTDRLSSICASKDESLTQILRRQVAAVDSGLPAGIVLVVDDEGRLEGTITDGDIRRALIEHSDRMQEVRAHELLVSTPITFPAHYSYGQVLEALPEELARRGRRSRKFLGKVVFVDDEQRPVRVVDYHQLWEQRVASHRHLVVVGLGYVGLTLALEMAREGFQVTGVDIDAERVKALQSGKSYVHEVGLDELLQDQMGKNFVPSTELPEGGDVFIICVGTPVSRASDQDIPSPQLGYIEDVSSTVGKHMSRGALVILRSTVPIGTTREIVVPILEKESGLEAGRDFHISFSPERTAEGNALRELRTLPQIIGGYNSDSVEATAALFRELTPTLVRVESLEAAELAKLINNSFRDYIFAFSNQVIKVSAHYNINVNQVIRAANRAYPRDKVPLPSPGVGGPCLTKDPYIMHHVAQQAQIPNSLFAAGRFVNESMIPFVVESLEGHLAKTGRRFSEVKVGACGMAFKGNPETGDLRSSTAVEIANLIKQKGAELVAHDPVATADDLRSYGFAPFDINESAHGLDVLLFLNNHQSYTRLAISTLVRQMNVPAIVYDAWNLFRPEQILSTKDSVYMSLGFIQTSANP